jgi:metalloendopeptidase OMA1, mitochondrial
MHTTISCIRTLGLIALLAFMFSCATAPITGRTQLMLVSPDQEEQLGLQAAEQILQHERLSDNPRYVEMVERVGTRIAQVANQDEYDWEFYTLAGDSANAFALPGGRIFFYEGIFKYADTEDRLATVMAHEIAHVLARHGGERLSMGLLTQMGQEAALRALNIQSPAAMQTFQVAYGVVSQVGLILPYGRRQELEADRIGLILQARAGYDPRAAVEFWQAMSEAAKVSPPAFLSTHPPDEQRIEQIREMLPEVMRYYQQEEVD